MTGLEKLSTRRVARCLDFSLKCTEHAQNSRFFPKNPNLVSANDVRDREAFKDKFAQTAQYRNSAIPFCQKLLNDHVREKRGEELARAGAGIEQDAGAGTSRGWGQGRDRGS